MKDIRISAHNDKTSETIAIERLEALIGRLGNDGRDTSSIRYFFEVGEWLIAFEGVENAFSEIPVDAETQEELRWLQTYFAD